MWNPYLFLAVANMALKLFGPVLFGRPEYKRFLLVSATIPLIAVLPIIFQQTDATQYLLLSGVCVFTLTMTVRSLSMMGVDAAIHRPQRLYLIGGIAAAGSFSSLALYRSLFPNIGAAVLVALGFCLVLYGFACAFDSQDKKALLRPWK
jgi:peptidoglycan/LPS O-acetylase OafA/YrhL